MKLQKYWAFWALAICLIPTVIFADTEAESETQAEELLADAEAQPDAEPDFQNFAESPTTSNAFRNSYYGMGQMGQGMGYYNNPYPSPNPNLREPSPCELTNQCCGLSNTRCCLGGQQSSGSGPNCYTTYVQKCSAADKPLCQVRYKNVCTSQLVKDCHIEEEIVHRTFKAKRCLPKPLKKCFDYQKKVCVPHQVETFRDITWENEKLIRTTSKNHTECYDYTTYDCKDVINRHQIMEKIPEKIIDKVTYDQCRSVPVYGKDETIKVPKVTVQYKQQCYDVNVPQCSTSACGQGYCNQGQSVCSRNQYNTQTVCPYIQQRIGPVPTNFQAPRPSCQQVREPVCNAAPGTTCDPGIQQCCTQTTRKVCRNVPVRSVQMVTQTRPGMVTYKQECKKVPRNITRYVLKEVAKMTNFTTKNCQPVTKQECHEQMIPEFDVGVEKKVERVRVMIPACKHKFVPAKYCHVFPDGDLECVDEEISRAFRITKIKCPSDRIRPYCFEIPITDCRLTQGQNCKLVPKKVCHETCSNDPMCNTCNKFVQGNGFGSCPTSQCGSFYPSDPFYNTTDGLINQSGVYEIPGADNYLPNYPGNGGNQYFPQGGFGLGEMYPGLENSYLGDQAYAKPEGQGDEGYFPGPGGEGYFPGPNGPVGGNGFFPGRPGGDGSFPGPGGEGFYPGPVGGQGYFPQQNNPGIFPGGSGGNGFLNNIQGAQGLAADNLEESPSTNEELVDETENEIHDS